MRFTKQLLVRVLAAIAIVAPLAIMASDFIRMSIVASQKVDTLERELLSIPAPRGTERAGIMRSHKSRIATVSEKYVGSASTPGTFDYYQAFFEGHGWRHCGHSIVRDEYCRDDYQAIVSVPSAMGSGTYSLTLQWNQITWRVWLAVCALIGIASLAARMLERGGGPPSSKLPILLYSRLSIAECLRRLDSAAEKNIGYYQRTSVDNRVTFELERRRGRFSGGLLAPYFYGVLQGEGDSTGTTAVGRFGFPPRARAGAMGLASLAALSLFISVFLGGSSSVEWMALAFIVGTLGLFVNRWRLRHEKTEIIRFLASALDASEQKPSRRG